MKLVCMTQVYNQNTFIDWDGKTNIDRFMESVSKYCDGLVAFDDGSTDGTREAIARWSGDIEIEIPGNKKNTPDMEGLHRARCLEHCRRMGADWVLCLDPDEVFEPKVERGALRALCEMDEEVNAYEFTRIDLWRTDRYIRVDAGWSALTGTRLFRLNDLVSFDVGLGMRSTLEPEYVDPPDISILKMVHFGYANDLSIILKYKRFKSLGVSISDKINDDLLRLCDTNPNWLSKPLDGPGISAYDKMIFEVIA